MLKRNIKAYFPGINKELNIDELANETYDFMLEIKMENYQ